jgi:hypothetical protein
MLSNLQPVNTDDLAAAAATAAAAAAQPKLSVYSRLTRCSRAADVLGSPHSCPPLSAATTAAVYYAHVRVGSAIGRAAAQARQDIPPALLQGSIVQWQ